jgi:hypothetical protein
MTHRIESRATGFLAVMLTGLALGSTAVPASARTFDFNTTGSMIQQPVPADFACAMRRATVDRTVSCRGIGAPAAAPAG